MNRRRIAVVGSGVAGLTAAHVLQRSADVTLLQIDTGFIVHNQRTYPTLLRLFAELGVATQDSDMSMSVRCGGCGLEYAGARGLAGLFPSARRLREPRYLAMLAEVVRFHRRARRVLADDPSPDAGSADQTLAGFLVDGRFSPYFRSHFMTPLVSAVWSCSPQHAGLYPARYLFTFLDHHGMLGVTGSPTWRTVTGGSARYVELAAKSLTSVLTSTPVRTIERHADGIDIRDDTDAVTRFEGAVVATHPDQALAARVAPSELESRLLGAITYSHNPTVLHTDAAVLPRLAKAQASWNYYLPDCGAPAEQVQVTYDMNRLQSLDSDTRYLVSLNSETMIAPERVLARMHYQHPIFTPTSVTAQRRLPELNDGTLAYAGAYHGWGFHEDGARSGVAAAASLGAIW